MSAADVILGKAVLPSHLSSASQRAQLAGAVRRRSLFSARTTSARYLEHLKSTLQNLLSGQWNETKARDTLRAELERLGYDSIRGGFPGDRGIPPAPAGSLRDLAGTSRLQLILDTQQRMARSVAQAEAGNTESARYAYPAWRLQRIYPRHKERDDWLDRWQAAGDFVHWEGAIPGQMVALKSSPIWEALGAGGDYGDTLGNPYPPFAFNSGLGWREVPRAEAQALGLGDADPTDATLSPGEQEIMDALDRLDSDIVRTLFAGATFRSADHHVATFSHCSSCGGFETAEGICRNPGCETNGNAYKYKQAQQNARVAIREGNTGTAEALGLPDALELPAKPRLAEAQGQDIRRRFESGEAIRATDPAGHAMTFEKSRILDDHWMASGKTDAEMEARLRRTAQAVDAVERPTEIWVQSRVAGDTRLYLQVYEGGNKKKFMRAYSDPANRSAVRTFFAGSRLSKQIRQGRLLYADYT